MLNFVESVLAGIASNHIYNMQQYSKCMMLMGILLLLAYKNRIRIFKIIKVFWGGICNLWIKLNLDEDVQDKKLRSLISPNNLMQYFLISYGISTCIFEIIGLAIVHYFDWLTPSNSVIIYTSLISIFILINIMVMKGITEYVKYKYYHNDKFRV